MLVSSYFPFDPGAQGFQQSPHHIQASRLRNTGRTAPGFINSRKYKNILFHQPQHKVAHQLQSESGSVPNQTLTVR
jgi:hypothetical protein